MYEAYFGLSERPFSIAPDPQYLYMSSRHKEAMAHLSYGLSQGGCFIVLTGEVGTGKTTLCRNLLSDLPDNVDVALILNANINETELLQTICDELKITYRQNNSQKHLLDLINKHLLATFAANRHTVLIIDEAQLLSRDVLEQIRLLTNLETTKHKLLQIILIGQPELNRLLARNDLRQLAQRVTARYHLDALRRSEIDDYVNFRLGVAGCKQPLFSKQALSKLHKLSGGIPRKINVLADHSLLAAYAQTQALVDSKIVKQAAKDVFIETAPDRGARGLGRSKWWVLASLLLLLNVALWVLLVDDSRTESDEASPAVSNTALPAAPLLEPIKEVVADNTAPPAEPVPSLTDQVERPPDSDTSSPESVDQTEPISAGSVTISEELLDASTDLPSAVDATDDVPSAASKIASSGSQNNKLVDEDTDFGRVLETSADLTGRITAFRRLSEIWDVKLPEQLLQPACKAIAEQALRCLGFSSWAQLRRFNRPAIFVLAHRDQLHRVIVQGVTANEVEVQLGQNLYRLTVEELRARWTGGGVLLWRPTEAGTQLRQLGDQSTSLPETRRYLNRALTRARMPVLDSVDAIEFDLDMSQKVFALQTRFSISGDSKIGNETYLLMNELVKPETTPVLASRQR